MDLMEQIPELSTPVDLKTYFMGRISNILAERNLVVAGWEEIAMKKVMKADSSFTYIAHPDFTKSNFLPYVWQNLWGKLLKCTIGMNEFTSNGRQLCMCARSQGIRYFHDIVV